MDEGAKGKEWQRQGIRWRCARVAQGPKKGSPRLHECGLDDMTWQLLAAHCVQCNFDGVLMISIEARVITAVPPRTLEWLVLQTVATRQSASCACKSAVHGLGG